MIEKRNYTTRSRFRRNPFVELFHPVFYNKFHPMLRAIYSANKIHLREQHFFVVVLCVAFLFYLFLLYPEQIYKFVCVYIYIATMMLIHYYKNILQPAFCQHNTRLDFCRR